MEPIQIKYELFIKGETENKIKNTYKGKKTENVIEYREGTIAVVLTFLEKKIIMNRKTSEYEIEMIFEENGKCKGKYDIKDIDMDMYLIVTTEKVLVKENYVEILYSLTINEEDIGHFDFKLEYEVIV